MQVEVEDVYAVGRINGKITSVLSDTIARKRLDASLCPVDSNRCGHVDNLFGGNPSTAAGRSD